MSKRLLSSSSSNTPKRQNLNKDIRKYRINDIKEEIEDINHRISYKEKWVSAAENMKNYKTYATLHEKTWHNALDINLR